MITIKIFLGYDHQGVKCKDDIINYLNEFGYIVETPDIINNDNDDYPDYAKWVCEHVLKEHSLGILVCGSGIGMSIVANKFKGIRCARVVDSNDAFTAKNHNGANVIAFSANIPTEEIHNIIDNFIMTKEPSEERHLRRIEKINKIESEKMEVVEVPYNFKEEIESLTRICCTRIGNKPIEFHLNIAEDIPHELFGDKVHIKQIVNNLLTNAIKYTEKGNINLNIRCINKDDTCTLFITVQDTGRGIKKEDIDKLFTKFERLDVEKNTTTEGTGLGLAITKKLVEMMGGKIVVQSIYGKGSIFTISLDQRMLTNEELTKVMKEKETEEKTDEIIDASGKNILVVDDNMLNLKVAERLLKAYKCNITLVSSGSECLDKVSNNKYDLILLDDMMPRMSGTETLQKLKEIETFNTPVVALTANAITGMKEEYINRGFNDYLSKPIIKEDLNRVMKKYLKK